MLPALVGRHTERRLVDAALRAGRHLLIEGPAGTGKSVLVRHAARAAHRDTVVVEGSAALTGGTLLGQHEPEEVLRRGFSAASFVDGPLLIAMRRGLLLHVEEANRAPAETLNLLLGPLAERRVTVPRMGEVQAAPGFALVATINDSDPVGATPLSAALMERLVRIKVGYQDVDDERAIVADRVPRSPPWLLEAAVALTRASRDHPDLLHGSSVRGAIDLLLVVERLAILDCTDLSIATLAARDVVLQAALVALSGRVKARDPGTRSAEDVLRELWEDLLVLRPPEPQESATAVPLSSVITRRRPAGTPPAPPPGEAGERTAHDAASGSTTDAAAAAGGSTGGRTASRPTRGEAPDAVGPADRTTWSDDEIADLAELAQDESQRQGRRRSRRRLAGTDPELVARIAVQIIVRRARRAARVRPGPGPLRPARYRFRSDDLDLDRTLEELLANPYPRHEDIWVHERTPDRRGIALLLDVSGSMRGSPLVRAALAAASVSAVARDDDLTVVLFWSRVSIVSSGDRPRPVERLIEDILAVRPKGLTDLHLGLSTALRQLERSRARDKIGIVVTDGLGNQGGDPLPVARRFPRLHVVATTTSESRLAACRRLAVAGRGECLPVTEVSELPAALTRCLES